MGNRKEAIDNKEPRKLFNVFFQPYFSEMFTTNTSHKGRFPFTKKILKFWLVKKASTSFPYPRKATNSLPDKTSKNFFAAFGLKHFSITKKTNLTTQKNAIETPTAKKSKWTPPEGQFASIAYFINKCRRDVHKLKSNWNTKHSDDLVMKAADRGGATVVWLTDPYQQETIRQLSDPTFYTKVNKDLTSANQKIVKDTILELITKQQLPVTAQNLIINTPRTSCIYFKPKIHKANNPGLLNLSRAI